MAYSLAHSYSGDALLNGFNWIDSKDWSHGFVRYQSEPNAANFGLFAVDQSTGAVRLSVDHANEYDVSQGRPSIRIESKETYNHGLFVADFRHMPASRCGVWPAFWAYGSDWPKSGEIDIIEGINTVNRNVMTAHTTPGCRLGEDVLSMASGEVQTHDCDANGENVGCGLASPTSDTTSYGDAFNAAGGGIYAMLWDEKYIKVWHFDRSAAPADIAARKPQPDGWGKPQAVFGGDGCDVKSHFRDLHVVLNVNFCGDYGNKVWQSSGCSSLAPTCSEYVAKNPSAFADAYWDVNYIDAYALGPADAANSSSTAGGNDPKSVPSAPLTGSRGDSSMGGTSGAVGNSRFSSSSSTGKISVNNHSASNGSLTTKDTSNMDTSKDFIKDSITNSSSAHNSSTTHSVSTEQPLNMTSKSELANLPQTPPPTANSLNFSSKVPSNPPSIGSFTYLGCFSTNGRFKLSEKMVFESDMTLQKCVQICKSNKYAGVYGPKCYCTEEIDDNSRVGNEACNTTCPGNPSQYCGGRPKTPGKIALGIDATTNATQSGGADNSTELDSSDLDPSKIDGSEAKVVEVTIPVYPQPKINRRATAGSVLTIYVATAQNNTVKQPPPPKGVNSTAFASFANKGFNATHSNVTFSSFNSTRDPSGNSTGSRFKSYFGSVNSGRVESVAFQSTKTVLTTIHYETVYEDCPSVVVSEQFVATVVQTDCGCPGNTMEPVTTVPMVTKVVVCSACGHEGADSLTVTVPRGVSKTTARRYDTVPTRAAVPQLRTGASKFKVDAPDPDPETVVDGSKPEVDAPKPAAAVPKQPVVAASQPSTVPLESVLIAGASGVKVTTMLLTAMLAMLLLVL